MYFSSSGDWSDDCSPAFSFSGDASAFDAEDIARLASQFEALLANVVADPSVTVGRVEVLGEAGAGTLDDFRELRLYRGGRENKQSAKRDKGHAAELEAFIAACHSGARRLSTGHTKSRWRELGPGAGEIGSSTSRARIPADRNGLLDERRGAAGRCCETRLACGPGASSWRRW